MSLEYLKKSLKEAPIVKKGDYHYLVHPITDGVPEIKVFHKRRVQIIDGQ